VLEPASAAQTALVEAALLAQTAAAEAAPLAAPVVETPPAEIVVLKPVPPAPPVVAETAPSARPEIAEAGASARAAVADDEPLAQTNVAEAAPLARMIVVEPAEPDADREAAVTYWPALPSDDEAPPWSVEPADEPAPARRTAARTALTSGPGLARAVLIALVCLAAVLGFARGVTMGTIVHLATGATQPTLAQYRQLRAGLSYDQVDAIFGGKLGLSGSSADARVHRSYGGARLDLRFSGGVLQSFAERGLSEGPTLRVLRTAGTGALLFTLAGGLASAATWWLLLFIAASWRGQRLTAGQLAALAGAGLAVGLAGALLLPVLLGCAIAFAVFLGLLIGWARREVAEALIVAAIAVAGGSLAVWLPALLGLQLSLLFAH
jgi:hypothetical protein